MRWRIRQGQQLCNHRGEVVAESGELIDAEHPAVVACTDMSRIAFVEPVYVEPAPVVASDADPGDEAPAVVVLDPKKLAAFGRKPEGKG